MKFQVDQQFTEHNIARLQAGAQPVGHQLFDGGMKIGLSRGVHALGLDFRQYRDSHFIGIVVKFEAYVQHLSNLVAAQLQRRAGQQAAYRVVEIHQYYVLLGIDLALAGRTAGV